MKNLVYKLIPKDMEQENAESIEAWFKRLSVSLNQLPSKVGFRDIYFKVFLFV